MMDYLTPEAAEELGVKFLLSWRLDLIGECCCPLGSRRWTEGGVAVGSAGACARPGKHPWWTEDDEGDVRGYRHGALEAGSLAEALAMRNSRNRLAAVPGPGVIVVDLDSDRAFRTYVRLWEAGSGGDVVAVAQTVRGWHLWMIPAVGEWSQIAGLAWMKESLGKDMGGLDIRTGERSYVLWPELDRRWVPAEEWQGRLVQAARGFPLSGKLGLGPVWLAGDPGAADVNLEHKLLMHCRGLAGSAAPDPRELTQGDVVLAAERLTLACKKLLEMPAGAGRNNRLNQIAFYDGALAVWAGMDYGKVLGQLMGAGAEAGTHGVGATVKSGLGAGMRALKVEATA